MAIDIWVVDLGHERDLGGLEGVVDGEVDVEEEEAPGVWRLIRSTNSGLPVVKVRVINWTGRAGEGRVLLEVIKFLVGKGVKRVLSGFSLRTFSSACWIIKFDHANFKQIGLREEF